MGLRLVGAEALLTKDLQTHRTYQTRGVEGSHVLREALDTVEGYRCETMTLHARLAIADQTIQPGIHHLHFDGVLTGFQLAFEVHLVRGFPQEVHMLAIDEDIGHLTHFAQIDSLRLNRNYYKAGVSKMSELLEAQMLYQQSCDKRTDAFADYQNKLLEYRQSIGQ